MAAAAPVAAAPAAAAPGATDAATAPVVPQQRFKLEILATIKVAQQQNGLRHADYQRYRQYCSRRLQRVRKALGLLHPRKEPFKKKAIEAKHLTDAKVLSIPLLSAERAWAYAMQLKADMAEEKDNTRLKFHLLRRLTKAARHATELEQLCGTAGDARAQLEADAYRNWMHANVAFEKNNFADALQRFQHTKTVYEQMGKTVDRGTQLLCEERVAAIEPSIKYCKMVMAQRGGAGAGVAGAKAAGADAAALAASSNDAILRAKLESVLEDTRKAEAKNLERVSWQNAQWTVESEKLRVKFVEIKELAAKFQKKEEKGAADLKAATSPKGGAAAAAAGEAKPPGGAAADAKGDESDSDNEGDGDNPNVLYVHLLSAYDEAINLIRDELKELKKGGDTAHSKEKEATLNALRNYTAFSKLKATGERNLIMAEHAARTYRVQIAEEQRAKEAAAAAAALKAANKLSKKQKKAAAAADAKASADAKDAKAGDAKDVKADAAAQAKGDKAKAKASKAQHQHQKKKVKPDDAVVLYEKLIQNTAELAELVPSDKPLLAALQARAAAYKAHRCLYLADAYRAIAKWTEAHALYSRTQQLAAAALPLLQSALDKASAAVETAQLQDVQRLAGAAQAVVHATGVLEALDRAKAAKAAANAGLDAASASAAAAAAAEQKGKGKKGSATPLVERLDAFDAGDEGAHHSLVSFPPHFQAVPCKPTLFDLAFNGISYPNIDARLKAKPAAPAPAAAAAAAAAKPAPAPATKSFLGRLFGR